MELSLSWDRFKWRVENCSLNFSFEQIDDRYLVWAQENNVLYKCMLEDEDVAEFEESYMANGNVQEIHRASVDNREMLYVSHRPMGWTTYFTGAGDTENNCGAGEAMNFWMKATDKVKRIQFSFNTDVMLKDGFIIAQNAPFGSCFDMEIVHPLYGCMEAYCMRVPLLGDNRIPLDSEDRGYVPQGLLMRVTVYNSPGGDNYDPPCEFRFSGRLEMFRETTLPNDCENYHGLIDSSSSASSSSTSFSSESSSSSSSV